MIIVDNKDLVVKVGERLRDEANQIGIVIGQNETSIGVKMLENDNFNIEREISTIDRATNITLNEVKLVTFKNNTSPGLLFPDTQDESDVKVGSLSNITTASIITDEISNFLDVRLDAVNFNTSSALIPMSGSIDPVSLNSDLNLAFDLELITFGSIEEFFNINPGVDYVNDAFAIAEDSYIKSLQLNDQYISIEPKEAVSTFVVGELVTETNTQMKGKVNAINATKGFIKVTPYSYYGFSADNNILRTTGDEFEIVKISRSYDTPSYGTNAKISSRTEFTTGRISKVEISNSGFGYDSDQDALLVGDSGEIHAKGIVVAKTQGKTAGYWGEFSSHLNGFKQTDGELSYYDSGMKLQDSNFYQEYSYQIKSRTGQERYETLLKDSVHLAGTKVFGKFSYKKKFESKIKPRFVIRPNDQGTSPLIEDPPI
jgi:hypothetical protein